MSAGTHKGQDTLVLPDGAAAAAEGQEGNSTAASDEEVGGDLVQLVAHDGRHVAGAKVRH